MTMACIAASPCATLLQRSLRVSVAPSASRSAIYGSFGRVSAASSASPSRPAARHTTVCRLMASTAAALSLEGKTLHDFTVTDTDGKEVSLSAYKGKVALVVNVASKCGLTQSNYTELTGLYNKYKDQGFVVLAFPSNQFGGQEPGSNEQIKEFACSIYKAQFPLFSKIDVNGPATAPVYQFLKSQKGGGILGDSIKWNFGKFLVDKDGKVVERYAPTTSPMAIEADIQKLL